MCTTADHVRDRARRRSLRRGAAAALTLLALLAGCATTGPHGEQSLILIDTATEVQMGLETDKGIRQEYPVYPDPELAAYVSGVGARVAENSERTDVKYTFTVLDTDVVNAFAAPGGYVYVTTGLLRAADDEAELAGVLAHEVGHVIGRHAVRQIQQAMGVQVAAQLLLGDHDNQAWQQLSGLGAQLFMMKHSREHEFQADQFGVKYAIAAGYDPNGIVDFFETLTSLYGSGPSGVEGWFATHPATEERIARAQQEIALYDLSGRSLERDRERYQQATAGLRN